MKADEYKLLRECVESGVRLGWSRAHKHHEHPTPGQIQLGIADDVMLEINEYFFFEGKLE